MELNVIGAQVARTVFRRGVRRASSTRLWSTRSSIAYQANRPRRHQAQMDRARSSRHHQEVRKQKGGGRARHGDYRARSGVGGGATLPAEPDETSRRRSTARCIAARIARSCRSWFARIA